MNETLSAFLLLFASLGSIYHFSEMRKADMREGRLYAERYYQKGYDTNCINAETWKRSRDFLDACEWTDFELQQRNGEIQ